MSPETPRARKRSREQRRLLSLDQLLFRLNVTRAWFLDHGEALFRDHDFPHPLPGLPPRWDPLALDLWLDRFIAPGRDETQPPETSASATDDPDDPAAIAAGLGGGR